MAISVGSHNHGEPGRRSPAGSVQVAVRWEAGRVGEVAALAAPHVAAAPAASCPTGGRMTAFAKSADFSHPSRGVVGATASAGRRGPPGNPRYYRQFTWRTDVGHEHDIVGPVLERERVRRSIVALSDQLEVVDAQAGVRRQDRLPSGVEGAIPPKWPSRRSPSCDEPPDRFLDDHRACGLPDHIRTSRAADDAPHS
jgi:hypothetical protein